MPRRDGTGPYGLGPLTGRRMGYCNSNSVSVKPRERRFRRRRYRGRNLIYKKGE